MACRHRWTVSILIVAAMTLLPQASARADQGGVSLGSRVLCEHGGGAARPGFSMPSTSISTAGRAIAQTVSGLAG